MLLGLCSLILDLMCFDFGIGLGFLGFEFPECDLGFMGLLLANPFA